MEYFYIGQDKRYRNSVEISHFSDKYYPNLFTTMLDQEKRNRSFQNILMSYRELINQVRDGQSNKSRILITAKNASQKIKTPIIQYQETDWEFIKE